MYTDHNSAPEKGFTILELVTVMLILGITVMGALSIASPVLKKGRITATKSNMNEIIQVLSVYAQNNNRIPCPAEPDTSITAQPFGFERESGANGENIGSCLEKVQGIVPFKTLGISEDIIKDGWRNYITYHVSPVFTLDPDNTTRVVHKRCRTINKWVFNGDNQNPVKARFCCPGNIISGPYADIVISDGTSRIWPYDRDDTNGNFADSETPFLGTPDFDIVNENITAPAFILVSHGINGSGAFIVGNGGGRRAGKGAVGLDEDLNKDGSSAFILRPMAQVQNNNHFDDIIMWRTQDQLYAETGKATCMEP